MVLFSKFSSACSISGFPKIVFISVFHGRASPMAEWSLPACSCWGMSPWKADWSHCLYKVCWTLSFTENEFAVTISFGEPKSKNLKHFIVGLVRILREESSSLLHGGHSPCFYCSSSWLVIRACRQWYQHLLWEFSLNFSVLVMKSQL